MTELKTLKDIENKWKGKATDSQNIINELKAEAIKWVKEDRKCMKDMEHDDYLFICADARVDFIIDFFNLTEEEIPEEKEIGGIKK